MLPHIIRCGGPKGRRKPVNLVNPTAAQFAALNNRFVPGDTFTFGRTASEITEQFYSMPFNNAKTIQFVLDGAAGGKDNASFATAGNGQLGARATATVSVAAAQSAYTGLTGVLIYLGGRGSDAGGHDGGGNGGKGGANGGANGWGSGGPGGGGRTDIRRTATATTEILVAGGGGTLAGTVGNSGTNYSSTRVNGDAGPAGETGGSPSYPFDTGGGAGGYYGGGTTSGDDPSIGYGGSSWADPSCTSAVSLPAGGAASRVAQAIVTILS